MPHPKPAEGNVALIRPPEGAVAAAAAASEADDRWVWFEDEHGERFRVPRSWVQGTPADASNAGGSAEEADPDEAGGIHIKNPTLSRMFEGVRLTSGQASLVPKLQAFLDDDEARIFILRGYAGTGKTFLMKGVVDYLSAVNRSVHLMAPTGRAAKVLSTRTSRSASTIHAHLYSPRDRDDPDDEDFTLVSDLTSNTDELDAVYVVDEASMVSDRETQNPLLQFGSGRLLADLLHFLEDAPCAHRRHILFVGDAAQLPPVGMTVSPALSPMHLEEEFGLKPSEHMLFDNGDGRGLEQPPIPSMKYTRGVIYKINQKNMTVQQLWEVGKELGNEYFSPVTGITQYQADKNSMVVFYSTAGLLGPSAGKDASREESSHPYLCEYRWGETKPAVELQFNKLFGYQAMPISVEKAFTH